MNLFVVGRVGRVATAVIAAGALCSMSTPCLFGGDPIDFSGGRSKGVTAKDNKLDERLQAVQPAARSPLFREAPSDSEPSPTPRDTRESREERRQRLAREEHKYFLLYEPGELQKKDGEGKNFGLGDLEIGGRDRRSLSRDWLTSDSATESRKGPGGKEAANGKEDRPENAEARSRQNEDAEVERSRGVNAAAQATREGQTPAHMSKELDFKDLLGSSTARSESSTFRDKTDYSLRDVVSPSDTRRDRAQQARMDNFRQMLNGNSRGDALASSANGIRSPAVNAPGERSLDGLGKPGGRDAFGAAAASSPNLGDKLRTPASANAYQRPSMFPNAGPTVFGPSDPAKARPQPADFESLKKRVR